MFRLFPNNKIMEHCSVCEKDLTIFTRDQNTNICRECNGTDDPDDDSKSENEITIAPMKQNKRKVKVNNAWVENKFVIDYLQRMNQSNKKYGPKKATAFERVQIENLELKEQLKMTQCKIARLEERIEELIYAPGGEAFQEAKTF